MEPEDESKPKCKILLKGDPHKMYMKKCTVEPKPDPPPPDPCKEQRIKMKLKAGIKLCPPPEIPEPTPPPECLAICIEKVKNPDLPPRPDFPIVCATDPVETPQPIPSTLADRYGGPTRVLPPPFPCQKPPPDGSK